MSQCEKGHLLGNKNRRRQKKYGKLRWDNELKFNEIERIEEEEKMERGEEQE